MNKICSLTFFSLYLFATTAFSQSGPISSGGPAYNIFNPGITRKALFQAVIGAIGPQVPIRKVSHLGGMLYEVETEEAFYTTNYTFCGAVHTLEAKQINSSIGGPQETYKAPKYLAKILSSKTIECQ